MTDLTNPISKVEWHHLGRQNPPGRGARQISVVPGQEGKRSFLIDDEALPGLLPASRTSLAFWDASYEIMTPMAVMIEDTTSGLDGLNGAEDQASTSARTLLLSPPSLASHPDTLNAILAAYDRSVTDLQMLDRLKLGLVTLADASYDTVVILDEPDASNGSSTNILGREVFGRIHKALKPGGRLQGQNETFASKAQSEERREAILAGLVVDGNGHLVKPEADAVKSVPLRLGKKSAQPASIPAASAPPPVTANGKRKSDATDSALPAGVGFVNGAEDLEDDDELIDEDTLLDEEDLARPITQRKHARSFVSIGPADAAGSARVPSQGRQATTRLQRLYVRTEGEDRGRGRDQTRQRRPGAADDEAGRG